MFKSVMLEADKLLIKSGICELPLSLDMLKRIAEVNGWIIDTYEESNGLLQALNLVEFSEDCPAFTFRKDGQYVILYRETLSLAEKIPLIAHEFGHIMLNHIADSKQGSIVLSTSPEESARQEAEAEAFARELLMPACIMKRCGITTHKKFKKLNLITGAYEYEQLTYINNSTFTASEEVELCERFKGYIFRTQFSFLKLFGIFAAILAVITAFLCYPIFNKTAPDEKTAVSIFITKSGEKYHKENCPYISGNDTIEMEISEAELAGYEPCKYCFSDYIATTLEE